ncbi:MAG TPA: hypothetical protein VEU62_02280 [Bryobacterales bacterium]|nr:hypothetical protein [Bryobacterales bacterium]
MLDASSLVTLAQAHALSLLTLLPDQALTVTEVYREAVEAGRARGYPDALLIADAFSHRWVTIADPAGQEPLPGISRTDSLVIHLAEELGAVDVLINDRTLLGKAKQRRLPARLTADFVEALYQRGRITRKRRHGLLSAFVAQGRYSEEFMKAFLLLR